MSKIIYVTGGARSGKSTFAEKQAMLHHPQVTYIATSIAFDDEMKSRIMKHRQQRPSVWKTIEAYKNMEKIIKEIDNDTKAILLDCLTIMASNLILEEDIDWDDNGIVDNRIDSIENKVMQEVDGMLRAIRDKNICAILVSNELGMGLVPPYKLGRIFRDIAGRMNQLVAREADEAFFLVSGIPIKLK